MLSILVLLTNIASAQVVCTPATEAKAKNVAACGADRVTTFTNKNQKVDSVTLVFKNDNNGSERSVVVAKPGVTVEQINNNKLATTAAVKKEIEKIKKDWNLKKVSFEVSHFEVGNSAALYSTADLKTKATMDKIKKVNRNVASDNPPAAGGVARATKGK